MRTIWLIAAIGACAALSSCDQDQQQAAQTAAPPAPACACRPTPPQETEAAAQTAAPVSQHRHHSRRSEHRDYAWNGRHHWRNDYSRTDFSESVLAPYDYVSQSSVSYTENDYSGERAYDRGGYRHAYRGDTIPASMNGERLDPWAGYDVRCPWL
jgi:hypothetical protein